MTEQIVLYAENNVSTEFHFKNAELNRLSGELAKRMNKARKLYADTKKAASVIAEEQSRILGEVMAKELYKEDGFKSIKEYAAAAFPQIGEQTAYKLAQAGIRFYNNDSPTAQAIVGMFGGMPLTMNEFKTLTDEQIQEAIDSGEINADMKQSDIRNFVTATKAKDETAKPVPTFNVQMALTTVGEDGSAVTSYKMENGVVNVGNASAIAGWMGEKWTAFRTPVKAVNGDVVYLAIHENGNEWARLQVKKREDGKTKKAKAANIREVTAEQLAEIFGLDLETAVALKAKQTARDSAK